MMVKDVLSSTPIHVVHVVGSFLIVARDLLSRMHGCMDECIPEGVLNYYGLRLLSVYGCMDVGCDVWRNGLLFVRVLEVSGCFRRAPLSVERQILVINQREGPICILDVISRIWIYIPDVISRIWIYILDFGNLGTSVANGSIRILTLDITSRIYIQILVIWVPMLQMDRSEY